MNPVYSLVIPVYKNEASLVELMQQIASLAADLDAALEVIFVVDGSPDNSYYALKNLCATAPCATQLVVLSRNFGSFAAIRMGLSKVRGKFVAIMAADLQEPISLIKELFAALKQGQHDVAIGTRTERADSFCSRVASHIFWGMYRRLIQREMPKGGVDIFAVTRPVADILLQLKESNSSLVGLLFWVGFRRAYIPYARLERKHGKSAWSFRRKLRYMMDSSFAFSDLPISLMLSIGGFGVAGSMILSLYIFTMWIFGYIQVPGYTAIMLVLLFMFATTLLSLGIIGAYVWRAFENTKQRPAYIPMLEHIFEPHSKQEHL